MASGARAMASTMHSTTHMHAPFGKVAADALYNDCNAQERRYLTVSFVI